MTEEEKDSISRVMWSLGRIQDEMDDEDPISESDYNRWREMIIEAYDNLLELIKG